MLPTTLEAMVLCAALARLGAVQNPILPIYRAREVRFIARQTGAQLLCVPGDLAQLRLRGDGARGRGGAAGPARAGRGRRRCPRAIPPGCPPPPAPARTRSAAPCAGTSTPRARPPTRRARATPTRRLLASFRGLVRVLELGPDDRHALVFPFTHVGGVGWLLAGLLAGFAHVIVAAFDPKTTIPLLARHDVTLAGAGTAFHQAYLAAQRGAAGAAALPALRALPGGGAPKPPALHDECKRWLGGVGIVSGYGLTECPIIAMNSVRDPDEKLADTEGRANPPEARDPRGARRTAAWLAPGEEGELLRARPAALPRLPRRRRSTPRPSTRAASSAPATSAGSTRTATWRSPGALKDVIIRKGENISAREVEDLLYEHPKVADVAVIGLPDPALGRALLRRGGRPRCGRAARLRGDGRVPARAAA